MNDRNGNSNQNKGTERVIGGQESFTDNTGKSSNRSGEWVMSDRPVPGPEKPQEGDNGNSGS